MRFLRAILILWVALPLAAQDFQYPDDSTYTLAFWNVENLFHPGRDSLNPDSDYTPTGTYHWTLNRYFRKLNAISRSLSLIGGWQGLDIIGLCEVESDSCLIDLKRRMPGYDYIHYDGPDRRGIDCALLYRTKRIQLLSSRPVYVALDSATRTRDLLYVCTETATRDTFHLIVCHLPSQWGGAQATEWKRKRAKQAIQTLVDSIYSVSNNPTIIVMGDMNSAPKDDIRGLLNMATLPEVRRWEGTHKYQGRWTMLDQFYVSLLIAEKAEMQVKDIDRLKEYDKRYLGYKPRRTYIGPRYNGGISDHYPILLRIKK